MRISVSLFVSSRRRISSCSGTSLYCETMPAPWRLSTTVLVCSEKTLPSRSLPTSNIAISFGIRPLRRMLCEDILAIRREVGGLQKEYPELLEYVTDFVRMIRRQQGARRLLLAQSPIVADTFSGWRQQVGGFHQTRRGIKYFARVFESELLEHATRCMVFRVMAGEEASCTERFEGESDDGFSGLDREALPPVGRQKVDA